MKRLREIRLVTHCVADLATEIETWSRYLGYALKDRGNLAADLCAAWNAAAETGRPYAIMAPANDTPVYIRFVETGERAGYWPPVTWGWNATEILVQDPDELALQLQGSPIKRFGGPMDLHRAPKAPRAMQTLGPSGAMLYFARLLPGGSRYGLHGAKIPVDRIFNVILGGPSLDKLREFYSNTMGLRVGDPMGYVGTLAAEACNAPPDTEFPICVAPLRARHSILELDEYPQNSAPRSRVEGCIPGGMSMVGFDTASLDDFPVPLRAEPAAVACFPYNGSRVAVTEGPAGEWLELIEHC
jgi:catechol 2,3-dioxygenase-like lactoylglutathione lyase family enzyme